MATFTDNGGRTWSVVLDAAAVERVRELAGVELGRRHRPGLVGDGRHMIDVGKAMEALGPATLVDTIHAICQPAAEAAGLTRGQFGRALHGAAVERATEAFVMAVIDTQPPQARRRLMAEWNVIAADPKSR